MVHSSTIPNVLEYISDDIGFLTDEIFGDFAIGEDGKKITDPRQFRFAKGMALAAPGPKFYTGLYISPDSKALQPMNRKIKGIPKHLSKKLTFNDYMGFIDGKSHMTEFASLKKMGVNLTTRQKAHGVGMFTIHKQECTRTINKTRWGGRNVVDLGDDNIYTVPNGYGCV